MNARWSVRQLRTGISTSGRRFNVTLADRWGTEHCYKSFRGAGLRRLGDALQDALDGTYGYTHEWCTRASLMGDGALIVDGPKIRISAPRTEFIRLVREIDNLLDD